MSNRKGEDENGPYFTTAERRKVVTMGRRWVGARIAVQ